MRKIFLFVSILFIFFFNGVSVFADEIPVEIENTESDDMVDLFNDNNNTDNNFNDVDQEKKNNQEDNQDNNDLVVKDDSDREIESWFDDDNDPSYPEGYEKDDNDREIESWFENNDGPDFNLDDENIDNGQSKILSNEFKYFIIVCIFSLGLIIGCLIGGYAFKWLN